MGYLTKEQILAAQDIVREAVPVPEWGGEVLMRGLSGIERDAFEASVVHMNGRQPRYTLNNLRAKLVALSVVDEAGERLFSDADVTALGRKSAAALERVFQVAQRLSGLSAQDIEVLSKNFESEPNGASGSG